MKETKEIEAKKRERYELMVVRVANYLNLSKAQTFEALPVEVREHLEQLSYCDLIMPLMRADRKKGLSLRALAVRYGLGKTTVSYHLGKKRPKNPDE